ncbi:hypothetical protein KDRO_D05170 [Kluyveromyces lactis]|nr:hypothetical protein KDRO_D05170 [Kluyveromyces lactis]
MGNLTMSSDTRRSPTENGYSSKCLWSYHHAIRRIAESCLFCTDRALHGYILVCMVSGTEKLKVEPGPDSIGRMIVMIIRCVVQLGRHGCCIIYRQYVSSFSLFLFFGIDLLYYSYLKSLKI